MENFVGKLVLCGHLYEFNESRELLLECGNRKNAIRIKDLEVEKDNRLIYCHPKSKGLFTQNIYGTTGMEIFGLRVITIPNEILVQGQELASEKITAHNNYSLEMMAGYYFVDQDLSDRLNTTYSTLKLDGIDYLLDVEKRTIRQQENQDIYFQFSKKGIQKGETKLYNFRLKQPVSDGLAIQKDIVKLHFPPLAEMDPIGYMSSIGKSATTLIGTLPWKADPKQIKVTTQMNLFQINVTELNRIRPVQKLERKLSNLFKR